MNIGGETAGSSFNATRSVFESKFAVSVVVQRPYEVSTAIPRLEFEAPPPRRRQLRRTEQLRASEWTPGAVLVSGWPFNGKGNSKRDTCSAIDKHPSGELERRAIIDRDKPHHGCQDMYLCTRRSTSMVPSTGVRTANPSLHFRQFVAGRYFVAWP